MSDDELQIIHDAVVEAIVLSLRQYEYITQEQVQAVSIIRLPSGLCTTIYSKPKTNEGEQ